MGLFSKLKANMNHGGVKVGIQAPASIPSDQVIPVQVVLTADSPQTINSVKVEIKTRTDRQVKAVAGGLGSVETVGVHKKVAVAESSEQFALAAGETKTVTLQLTLDKSLPGGDPFTTEGKVAVGLLGQPLKPAMEAIVQTLKSVTYDIYASVDVAGISLDPSAKQPIEFTRPA